MNIRCLLLACLAALGGCGPCPPGGGPCALIIVSDATTSQRISGANVEIIDDTGGAWGAPPCPTESGCYTRVGVGCLGSYSLRVSRDGYHTQTTTFQAPAGREYECWQRSYRVDVALVATTSR